MINNFLRPISVNSGEIQGLIPCVSLWLQSKALVQKPSNSIFDVNFPQLGAALTDRPNNKWPLLSAAQLTWKVWLCFGFAEAVETPWSLLVLYQEQRQSGVESMEKP